MRIGGRIIVQCHLVGYNQFPIFILVTVYQYLLHYIQIDLCNPVNTKLVGIIVIFLILPVSFHRLVVLE
jgi:hypothetical protein